MILTSLIITALFGLIIGSFLNVVILRHNTGHRNHDRSMCLSCATSLRWYELLPLISFFAFGRKCRTCKSAISWQYPLVELATSALFVLVTMHTTPLLLAGNITMFIVQWILLASIWSLLVVIFVYDLYHTIIPNVFVYSAAVLALVYRLTFFAFPSPVFSVDIVAGLILAFPFALLWVISRGRWLGLGDAKLAMVIGWLVGLSTGVSVIVLAVWIAAGVGVYLLVMSWIRHTHLNHELPFAPFLIFATLVGFLVPIDFFYNARILFTLL